MSTSIPGTMKALVKLSPGKGAELREVPVPRPGEGEVLVKVLASSICGSDLHLYQWNEWAETHVIPPRTMGHEMAGEVVLLGERCSRVVEGDRVSAETHFVCGRCYPCRTGNAHVCRSFDILGFDVDGAFAEYVLLPEESCWVNPPDLPPEVATLQEPAGNAWDTVAAGCVGGKNVLVTGAGPLGLLTIATARSQGPARLIVSEPGEYRRELAERIGADAVINPLEEGLLERVGELTGGQGANVLLELSGAETALTEGMRALTPGGRAVLLGLPDRPVPLDLNELVIFKSLTIVGVTGRRLWETWYRVSGMLSGGSLDLSPFITHTFGLEGYEEAFRLMEEGLCGKVVFRPQERPSQAPASYPGA